MVEYSTNMNRRWDFQEKLRYIEFVSVVCTDRAYQEHCSSSCTTIMISALTQYGIHHHNFLLALHFLVFNLILCTLPALLFPRVASFGLTQGHHCVSHAILPQLGVLKSVFENDADAITEICRSSSIEGLPATSAVRRSAMSSSTPVIVFLAIGQRTL